MYQSHEFYLRRCIEISKDSRAHGNAPFGALLVDKDGNILMEQENIEITEKVCTGHAEATLAARASHEYSKAFLRDCTLYTTAEPCAMCAGAIYWANIGRVVYGRTPRSTCRAATSSHAARKRSRSRSRLPPCTRAIGTSLNGPAHACPRAGFLSAFQKGGPCVRGEHL